MKCKDLQASLTIKQAPIHDYPVIQNLARFYVYDLSRECGFISEDWACPQNGLYESFDFKNYFEDSTRRAFLIRVGSELAGFILLNQVGVYSDTTWNIGEFFILAKFQGKGIGQLAAFKLWEMYNGLWEVSVIPENQSALKFWRKTISTFTNGNYTEEVKEIDYDKDHPKRYILRFKASA